MNARNPSLIRLCVVEFTKNKESLVIGLGLIGLRATSCNCINKRDKSTEMRTHRPAKRHCAHTTIHPIALLLLQQFEYMRLFLGRRRHASESRRRNLMTILLLSASVADPSRMPSRFVDSLECVCVFIIEFLNIEVTNVYITTLLRKSCHILPESGPEESERKKNRSNNS